MHTSNARFALSRLEAVHTREVIGIASMHHLCQHLLSHYASAQRVDATALLRKLDECVESHLFDRNIDTHRYHAAVTDLRQVGRRVAAAST